MMSYREALECSKHGEVLRWSTDSEGEETKATEPDKQPHISFGSDTTGSTPDICKSPDMSGMRVPGSSSMQTDVVEEFEVQARSQSIYTGVRRVVETENQASSSDSEDDIPVSRLLQEPKTVSRLNLQVIEECKEGPKGVTALGKKWQRCLMVLNSGAKLTVLDK